MTITELTTIIKKSNEKAIISELKGLGYVNCEKHKKYKYISIVDLFKGNSQETEEYSANKGKRTYQGGIFTQVKGYEQLEFIVININDDKHKFPIKMHIWAKEITR